MLFTTFIVRKIVESSDGTFQKENYQDEPDSSVEIQLKINK